MANPTWRNVEAPSFRDSMAGFQIASESLNRAFEGAGKTLTQFDRAQTDAVDKQFAMALARYQDPTKLKAALESGALFQGFDPNRLSMDAINAATSRRGALADQEYKGLQTEDLRGDVKHEGYTRERQIAENSALDAVKPIIAQFAAANGDQTKLNALRSNPDTIKLLSELSPDNQMNVAKTVDDLISGRIGIDQASTNLDSSKFNLSKDKISWDENRAALALAAKLTGSVNNGEDLELLMQNDADIKALSGPAQWRVRELLGGYVGSQGGGSGGGGGSGAGGGFGPPVGVTEDHSTVATTLSQGGLSDAVVAGFLGNFEVEGGYGGAQGDGGSASGIAQWRNERRANFKKQFGKDPHEATKAEQAKFVLWELNNPAAAGMKPEDAARIKAAKTPQEAAELIDALYERSSGEHRNRRVAAATQYSTTMDRLKGVATDAAVRQGQATDPGRPITKDYEKNWDNTTSADQVAADLLKTPAWAEKGKSESVSAMTGNIKWAMSKYGISAADAGALMKRHVIGSQTNIRHMFNPNNWLDGSQVAIDWKAVEQDAKRYTGNNGQNHAKDVAKDAAREAGKSGVASALAAKEAAEAAYARRLQEKTLKPNLPIDQYYNRMQSARAAYQQALDFANSVDSGSRQPDNNWRGQMFGDQSQAAAIIARSAGGKPITTARNNSKGSGPVWLKKQP